MQVTVQGHITSIDVRSKDDKIFTELMLAQKGEKELVPVRLAGAHDQNYSLFEIAEFNGRLLLWKTRDSIGKLVLVGDE